jgi:hypothetical protein
MERNIEFEVLEASMSESLETKIEMMKREIDALQISVTGQRKIWYKDFPTIISVAALLFSFGTTYVSYRHTETQDIQSQRQDLRGILQRLTALPKENLEMMKRYQGDGFAIGLAGSITNQENAMLARQAAEIARQLPKEKISATEYYSIAMAMGNALNFTAQKEFLQLCIENAKDFSDYIAALRASANLEFVSGHPEAGRVRYQEALNVWQKYPGYDQFTKTSTDVWTQLSWAGSEASMGTPLNVNQHIQDAENLLNSLPLGQGSDMLRGQVAQARATFTHGVPAGLSVTPLTPTSHPVP